MILVASALAADIDPLVLPGAGGLGSGNGQVGAEIGRAHV